MREAASALKLTAQDLLGLGVIDRVIPEPIGGAQRHRKAVIEAVGEALAEMLDEIGSPSRARLRRARRQKYLAMGSQALVA